MGLSQLTWPDLDAYARLMRVEFAPWQAQALIQMSQAYIGALQAGAELLCRPPREWDDPQDEDEDG